MGIDTMRTFGGDFFKTPRSLESFSFYFVLCAWMEECTKGGTKPCSAERKYVHVPELF